MRVSRQVVVQVFRSPLADPLADLPSPFAPEPCEGLHTRPVFEYRPSVRVKLYENPIQRRHLALVAVSKDGPAGPNHAKVRMPMKAWAVSCSVGTSPLSPPVSGSFSRAPVRCPTCSAERPGFRSSAEGADRNRTGVRGFAGRCVTTPPRRRALASVAVAVVG
jgi:hypothetical protein